MGERGDNDDLFNQDLMNDDGDENSTNSLQNYLIKQDMNKIMILCSQLSKNPKVPTILKDMVNLKSCPTWAKDGFISQDKLISRIQSPHKRPESRGLLRSSSQNRLNSPDKRPKVRFIEL